MLPTKLCDRLYSCPSVVAVQSQNPGKLWLCL